MARSKSISLISLLLNVPLLVGISSLLPLDYFGSITLTLSLNVNDQTIHNIFYVKSSISFLELPSLIPTTMLKPLNKLLSFLFGCLRNVDRHPTLFVHKDGSFSSCFIFDVFESE